MSIYSQIEWRLESAWVAVLADNIATATIARYNDVSREHAVPCILVHCPGSESPDHDIGNDEASVDLVIRTGTHKDQDTTGAQLHTLLGQVRDIIRTTTTVDALTAATSGLHVRSLTGLKTEIPPLDDDLHVRSAIVSVAHNATCTDTLDEPEDSA